MFQEHPYIFTKVNSFPSLATTTAPTTQSTAQPFTSDCSGSVPSWVAAVLAVVGLLVGLGVTWLLFSCRAKNSKRKMNAGEEMKSAMF